MNDAELDSLMCKVLSDSIALDLKSTDDAEIVFQPSQYHSEQMRLMLEDPLRWVKKRKNRVFQNAARWVAVILLFTSIAFGMVMLFSPEARAAVERWIVEWYQTHIVFRYYGTADGLLNYELAEIPEGFKEILRREETDSVDIIYENENAGRILLSYQAMQQGGATGIALNDDVITEVMVGRNKGILFIPQVPDSMLTLTWIDEAVDVQFTIMADMDEHELIELAESLRIMK